MSSTLSAPSEVSQPDWMWDYLGISAPSDGEIALGDQRFAVTRDIPRSELVRSDTQAQTEETFGFKWKKRDTFESDVSLKRMRAWLVDRYGNMASADWLDEHGTRPDHSLDVLKHINYDWYAPANAARQSPQEVREWRDAPGLKIKREIVEEAGITIIAKKGG